MSSESTRARDRTERGHQLHDEGAANPRRRNLMRSVRMVAVCFGPSIVLDLLLAASVAATASDALPDPNRSSSARLLLRRIATVGSLAPWAYLLALRPWHLRWGATSEETRMSMPGDELVPQPVWECTRAVSIRAPATEVWPWLVQMGQGRGGLYTYDWLENLAGLDIHSADRIIPELQHLEVGDSVGFSAEGEPTVASIEPDRFLALHISNNFSWVFVLKKQDERRTTRLILRSRIDANPRQLFALAYSLVVELPHFIMERRMLLGIKERAERAHEDQGALGTV